MRNFEKWFNTRVNSVGDIFSTRTDESVKPTQSTASFTGMADLDPDAEQKWQETLFRIEQTSFKPDEIKSQPMTDFEGSMRGRVSMKADEARSQQGEDDHHASLREENKNRLLFPTKVKVG